MHNHPTFSESDSAGKTMPAPPLCTQCAEWARVQEAFLLLERKGFVLPSTPKWNTAVQSATTSVEQRRCCCSANVNGMPFSRLHEVGVPG